MNRILKFVSITTFLFVLLISGLKLRGQGRDQGISGCINRPGENVGRCYKSFGPHDTSTFRCDYEPWAFYKDCKYAIN